MLSMHGSVTKVNKIASLRGDQMHFIQNLMYKMQNKLILSVELHINHFVLKAGQSAGTRDCSSAMSQKKILCSISKPREKKKALETACRNINTVKGHEI